MLEKRSYFTNNICTLMENKILLKLMEIASVILYVKIAVETILKEQEVIKSQKSQTSIN